MFIDFALIYLNNNKLISKVMSFDEFFLILQFLLLIQTCSLLGKCTKNVLSHPLNLENLFPFKIYISIFEPFLIAFPNADWVLKGLYLALEIELPFSKLLKTLALILIGLDVSSLQVRYFIQSHQNEMEVQRRSHHFAQIKWKQVVSKLWCSKQKSIINWKIVDVVCHLDDSIFKDDISFICFIVIFAFILFYNHSPPTFDFSDCFGSSLDNFFLNFIINFTFFNIFVAVRKISDSNFMENQFRNIFFLLVESLLLDIFWELEIRDVQHHDKEQFLHIKVCAVALVHKHIDEILQ